MVEQPPASPGPKQSGRRRRRALWLVVAAAVMVLIGRGLGWLGGAPQPQQGPTGTVATGAQPDDIAAVPAVPQPVPPAADAQLAAAPAAETSAPETSQATDTGERESTPPSPPSRQPSPDRPVLPAEGTPDVAVGMAPDRFASLVSLIELRLHERVLGSARASLQRLQAQPLDQGQRATVADLTAQLAALGRENGKDLVALLKRGEVLAALQSSERLAVDGEVRLGDWLAGALPVTDRDGDWLRAIEVGDQALPMAQPLARNRRVRLSFRGKWQVGGVVSSRSDQVTVRIKTESGQSYPTVATVHCEPVEAAPAEAVEMGFAAVHAGRPLLARLWLLRASLAAEALGERGQRLAQLLR